MALKRSPSQEPILPPEGPSPPGEPHVGQDWHRFRFYENPYLSGLYGAVGGLVAGGALLAILWYVYGIEFFLSVKVAGAICVVLLIGMSLSAACRCVVCILVPELLGKYGRWVLYTLLLAALVSGPVANISTNMERMSTSMSCSVEMIKNQTRDIKQQFIDPLNQIKEQITKIEDQVRFYANLIEASMEPIINAVKATASGLKDAANFLQKAADDCKAMFNDAYDSCKKFFSNAYKKCKSAIDKIPIIGSLRKKRDAHGVEIVTQEVTVQWSDHEDEEHRKFWEKRAEEILEETLQERGIVYPEHKLHEKAHLKEKYYNMTIRRFRRGLVSKICEIVNIGGFICAPLELTSNICHPLELLSKALDFLGNKVNELYTAIKNAFYFNIVKRWIVMGLNDLNQTASAIVAEIASLFSFNTYIIETSLSILTKWTSLLLIFMFVQSAIYVQHYLSTIDYDNNYISLNFRRFDRECRRLGKPSVLPFQENENAQYIFTSSLSLNGSEIKRSILSILQLLLNMILYAVVIFFDYVLYYVVYLVHTYGDVQIDFSGSIYIHFGITGDGFIAKMLQSLVRSITVKDSYYTTYNVTQCLPYPSYPDSNNFFVLLALNGGVFITIILQSYCYRLKRALCGFFYQKREEERIRYLHNKILHHRKFKLKEMRSRIKDAKQASDAERALARLPLVGALFGGKSQKRVCLHCGKSDEEGQHFYTCSRRSCYADYCENCFNEMGRKCLLCSKKGEDSVDDDLFFYDEFEGDMDHSETADTEPLLHGFHGEFGLEGQDNTAFSDFTSGETASDIGEGHTTTHDSTSTDRRDSPSTSEGHKIQSHSIAESHTINESSKPPPYHGDSHSEGSTSAPHKGSTSEGSTSAPHKGSTSEGSTSAPHKGSTFEGLTSAPQTESSLASNLMSILEDPKGLITAKAPTTSHHEETEF